ncbi:hypothetical protein BJV74DRAFT_797259 [Russula compacta]|nr:hypothetical protein BJV74DRAFT_797259 [Russula compacta]
MARHGYYLRSTPKNSPSRPGRESETVALDTPDRRPFGPTSPLRAPRAPMRHRKQGNWRNGCTESSLCVHDTMASIAGRRQTRHSHPKNTQARRRPERPDIQPRQVDHQIEKRESETSERIAEMRRDYERRVEEFRQSNAALFELLNKGEDGSNACNPTETPNPAPKTAPSACSRLSSAQYLGPSRLGPQMLEDDRGNQQWRQSDKKPAIPSADESYVVVTKRAGKLGPCNTWVIDHRTGEQIVETTSAWPSNIPVKAGQAIGSKWVHGINLSLAWYPGAHPLMVLGAYHGSSGAQLLLVLELADVSLSLGALKI